MIIASGVTADVSVVKKWVVSRQQPAERNCVLWIRSTQAARVLSAKLRAKCCKEEG